MRRSERDEELTGKAQKIIDSAVLQVANVFDTLTRQLPDVPVKNELRKTKMKILLRQDSRLGQQLALDKAKDQKPE
jgi:hypothetical protein